MNYAYNPVAGRVLLEAAGNTLGLGAIDGPLACGLEDTITSGLILGIGEFVVTGIIVVVLGNGMMLAFGFICDK